MGGVNYVSHRRAALPPDEPNDGEESESWEELPPPPHPLAGAAAASWGGRGAPRLAMLGKGAGGSGAKPAKPSFVSYVCPEEIHIKDPVEKEVNLRLLPGELLLCEASTVLKCIQEDGSNRGAYGKLICTNFKIAFLGDESASDDDEPEFKNKIIGENDITLHCVDHIYGVYDEKKKSLFGQLKKYPEKLIICCKDLRVFHFCLRYTKEEEVKRIVSGIVHHSQTPKLLKRLFLFSYATAAPTNTDTQNQTVMFDAIKDWREELERTKGNMKYKVVSANKAYKVSEKLPLYFVVPMSLSEEDILQYQGRGIPIWCWSCHNGASLLKMSAFPKEQEDNTSQMHKIFLDGVYKTINKPPYEVLKTDDLSSSLPSLQDIQTAYTRFKQLFLIDNSTDFWDTDVKWFSLLESTNWLEIVRRCLKKAIEVVEYLEGQNTNILLVEENASDLCCVISSLVQVMMDSHYRTKFGFQSLIQKEWVMGGHCFLDRCNHLRQNDKEEAPVFLLFLDCVWQLVQQYPPAFEFTETYLTVLSDSLYIPIFSTFFFNSQHQKDTNMHQRQLSLPLTQSKSSPKRGFFREETDHFIKNILGKRISKLINSSDELHNNFTEFYDSWHCKPVDFHGLLLPHIEGPGIKVWAQRYLRWIPEAQLLGGGTVATATKILDVMEEVQSLQKKMDENHSQTVSQGREVLPVLRNSARLSSLFPFALLQRHSLKPVLPTSTWKDLEDEEDLAKRDDEFVDLSDVI
ncbi:myotubularin-related protein 12 isoform X2 [Emydura macquarii macquarii]|uniref:myotubularin-related protein 12 isoform X2 n=1 Tax=Emydura macquarii macquarii TaxID=1129001 RepID=UPI00352B03DD